MNREIKFRAWHKGMKRIVPADELGQDQLTILPSTGQFINVSGVSTSKSKIYSFEEMIPMQFIGLKDKNGIEIYEGDILKGYFGNELAPAEVTYYFAFEPLAGAYIPQVISEFPEEIGFSGMIHVGEIIGNIYENPELLK